MQKNYKTFVKGIVLCAIVIYVAIFLIFNTNKGLRKILTLDIKPPRLWRATMFNQILFS